jgi:hypothetical protein
MTIPHRTRAGADSPGAGFFAKLRGRAAEAQRWIAYVYEITQRSIAFSYYCRLSGHSSFVYISRL